MKGRYPHASEKGKKNTTIDMRLQKFSQNRSLLMATLRKFVSPLFGLPDVARRDKDDSIPTQTATCARPMQWEFLLMFYSDRRPAAEKYRQSRLLQKRKFVAVHRDRKYRRHLRGCLSWQLPYPSLCRKQRFLGAFEIPQIAGDVSRPAPL